MLFYIYGKFLCVLIQGLTIQSRLAQDLLCSPGWPGTHDPPASASQVLQLQLCAIMPSLLTSLFKF
jgi:hypothetical protein